MPPDWWVQRCKKCGGTGWWYDEQSHQMNATSTIKVRADGSWFSPGLRACFDCDAPQLSVTAKTYDLGDAWPVEVTHSQAGT